MPLFISDIWYRAIVSEYDKYKILESLELDINLQTEKACPSIVDLK